MPNTRRSVLRMPQWGAVVEYALVFLALAAAVGLRWALDPFMGNMVPLATLFGAVAFAVWLRGWRAALIIALLGFVICDFLFHEPRYELMFQSDFVAGLAVFIAYAITIAIIIAVGEAARRAQAHDQIVTNRLVSITDAFIVVDSQWRYTYANDNFLKRIGKKREEVIGRSMWELFPDAVGNFAYVQLHEAMEHHIKVVYELFYEPWQRWFLDHAYPTPEGGLAIYTVDITERKEAEAKVRQSERQLRKTLDTAAVGLIRCSRDLRYLSANATYAEIVGLPVEKIVGKSIVEVLGEAGFETIRPYVERVLRGERVEFEAQVPLATTGSRYLNVIYAPDRDVNGNTVGWAAWVTDITERKRIEKELVVHSDKLQQLVDQRNAQLVEIEQKMQTRYRMATVGTMAAGLAHDMNDLTLPLGARLEVILKSSSLNEADREQLTAIATLVNHLRDLARNLSLFARDPEQEGSSGCTHLAQWCAGVTPMLAASIKADRHTAPEHERDISITCDCGDNPPPVAIAPHRLTQVVQNLVHNARDAIITKRLERGTSQGKFEPEVISVKAYRSDDAAAVKLDVTDRGIGMDANTKQHCIDPFFTTKTRTTPGASAAISGGTGLGMSMVYQIIERIGGEMSIQSKLGSGTTVSLTLPLAPNPAPEIEVKSRSDAVVRM